MKVFDEMAHRVLGMELDLHRGYAAESGIALTDRLAEESGPRARRRAERAYMVSSRCELACRDSAWQGHNPDSRSSTPITV